MRLLHASLWIAALIVPAAAVAQPTWTDNQPLRPAVKAAKTRLLVKVTTSWCGATNPSCRELANVLLQPEVARRLRAFRLLAYDGEQGEGQRVARRYSVGFFPTLLVIDRKGREVDRLTGHLPRQQLAQWLDEATSGKGTLAKLEARLARRTKDTALRLRVGALWALRGQRARAVKHLDRLIRAAGTSNMPSRSRKPAEVLAARAMLIKGRFLELRALRDHKAAEATLRGLRLRFPTAPEASHAVYPLARAMHGIKRTKAALRLLSWWARTPEQHQRVAWFCHRNRVDAKRGLRHARAAVKARPDQALMWATLAAVQDLAGDRAAAGRSWGKALRLDPHRRWYQQQHALHYPKKK